MRQGPQPASREKEMVKKTRVGEVLLTQAQHRHGPAQIQRVPEEGEEATSRHWGDHRTSAHSSDTVQQGGSGGGRATLMWKPRRTAATDPIAPAIGTPTPTGGYGQWPSEWRVQDDQGWMGTRNGAACW